MFLELPRRTQTAQAAATAYSYRGGGRARGRGKDYFHQGFCNEIIWPLFHDPQSHCSFVPEYWTAAQKVEQTFADVVQHNIQEDDLIWVHDYHLMGLGKLLAVAP